MDTRLNRISGVADNTVGSKVSRLAQSTPIANIPRDEREFDLIPAADVPYNPDYGIVDWAKDAFTDWNVTRNDTNFETEYGKYTRAELDKDILDRAKEYVTNIEQLNATDDSDTRTLILDNIRNKGLDLAYELLSSGKLSILSEDTDLNFDKRPTQVQKDLINKYMLTLDAFLKEALTSADLYAKNSEYWKNKHKLSDYYTAKQLSSNMDLTDLDTYVFKVPNLFGSSASSIKSLVLGTVGAAIAGAGATALAAGIEAGTAGLGTPAAAAVLGAGASLASNIYSRSEESHAEVYQNYKDKVRQNAEKAGVFNKALANAKKLLLQQNADDPTYLLPDDDKVLNDILSDKIKSGNEKFDKIRINSLNGLESLYTDNMALSAWDATEQVILVMPFGALAKIAKGTSTLAKGLNKGAKALDSAKGLKKAVSDKVDDVVTFGIEKTAENLGKMTLRKKLVDVGGRLALTGIMEGAEEGVQYIKGQEYIKDEYDTNPNLVKSWARNLGTGARAVYAALTPWDSVYSDDKEFMENFKGGAILGGLTTGVVAPIVGYKSISNDVSSAQLVGGLYADKLEEQDKVAKSEEYVKLAKLGKQENIELSFDKLSELNIEGLDPIVVAAEKKRAGQIMSAALSPEMLNLAIKLGIDPRTDDYNTFVALDAYYTDAFKESSRNSDTTYSKVTQMATQEDEKVELLAILKQYAESSKQLAELLSKDKASLADISKKHNLKINKESLNDVLKSVKDIAKKALETYTSQLDENQKNDEEVTVPPALLLSLSEAVIDNIYANALKNTVVQQRNEFLNNRDFTKSKIDKYHNRIAKDEEFVLELQDKARGILEEQSVQTVETPIVDPVPVVEPKKEQVIDIPEVELAVVEPLAPEEQSPATKEDDLLNAELAPLRAKITADRANKIQEVVKKVNDRLAYNTRRKFVDPKDTRTDEELGVDVKHSSIPSLNTKAGKTFAKATLKLESMYDTLKYREGPLKFGYSEKDFYNLLQSAFIDPDNIEGLIFSAKDVRMDDRTAQEDWYQLKDLKDQLEEAIFDGKPNTVISKLSKKVSSKIDEINSKEEKALLEELLAKQDIKPIEDKAIETSPVEVDSSVQTKVLPTEVPVLEANITVEPVEAVITEPIAVEETKVLTYDRRIDPYSHLANYWLIKAIKDERGITIGKEEHKFLGLEDAEYGSEFSKISAKDDLFTDPTSDSEIVVKDYIDKGVESKAMYLQYKYKGKKYVAAVTDPNSLSNNFKFNSLPYATQLLIRKNLDDLRNKILQLNEQVQKNPDLKIIPTNINRTNGGHQNAKDAQGAPINRKLTDTVFGIKDPYYITPDNTKIGIVTGPLGNRIVRFGTETWRMNGAQLGTAVWRVLIDHPNEGVTKNFDIHLNPKNFKQDPEMAEFVFDMMTATTNKYITKGGVETPFYPEQLLNLVVNFGPHTAVNVQDTRLTEDLIAAKLAKQFYANENGDITLGNATYTISDLLTDKGILKKVKQYILDNLHWNISEDSLWKHFAGANTLDKKHPLGALKAWFEFNKEDKLTIIPGKLEFTLKDVGLQKEGNKVITSKEVPNGISMVGWYIKNGILLTDVEDTRTDALLYIDDVTLVDSKQLKQVFEAKDKLDKEVITAAEPVEEKRKPVSFDDIFAELGPNSEIDYSNVFTPTILPETATEWLTEYLGLIEDQIKIAPDVIAITKAGMSVMGKATKDAIYLSSLAPEGTLYHEAWHRVSNLLISEKDRRKVFSKFTGTDKLIDEMLAEEFKQYMLDEAPRIDYTTTNWFKKIYNFIKTWSKVGNYGLARIYYNINTGKYKNTKVKLENLDRFQKLYAGEGANFEMNGTKFRIIPNISVYNNIINGLEFALLRLNNVYFYEDVTNLKFETLKEAIDAKAESSSVFKEISDKFESNIKPTLVARINNLNVRAIEKQSEEEVSDIDAGEVDNANVGEHTIASYQISKMDNAPAEVKFFFLTIPSYKFNEEGKKVYDTEKYTGFPKFVDAGKAWNTVLNDLHDAQSISEIKSKVATLALNDLFYDSINNKLSLVMHGLENSDPKIVTQSEVLLTRIENTIRSHKHAFITGKIDRNDDGTTSIRIIDNTVDIKSRAYPSIWSQSLFYNRKAFHQEEDGTVTITKEGLSDFNRFKVMYDNMVTTFKNKGGLYKIGGDTYDLKEQSNQDRFKNQITAMFNSIGIEIDRPTIDSLLMSGDYGNPMSISSYQLLNNFITSNNNFGGITSIVNLIDGVRALVKKNNNVSVIEIADKAGTKELRPISIFNNVGFVKVLAQTYSKVHLDSEELKSLGAEGNLLYLISQDNFSTYRVNEFNKDVELVGKLNAVVYNGGSLILEHLNQPNHSRLTVETFVNFRDSSSQDQGRDYFGITDREDYVSKLTMVLNDRILFPTVADKKTYHTIRGIKLPHNRINWLSSGNGMTAQYGDEVISRFNKYAEAELSAIELCLRQIDDTVDANGNHNPDWLSEGRRNENYHTPNRYKENGKWYNIEGNGTRFRFLTGVYLTIDGKEKFINFNDPKKSAIENLKTAKDYFFGDNITPAMRKGMLSTLISKAVKKEVNKAIDLGLIASANNTDQTYSLKNELLDNAELNTRADFYRKNGVDFVKNNAQAYAIYDMLADYTVNSIISIMEIEKLFSGDPAYYKWNWSAEGVTDMSIDKIKRLGALTSTGLNNRLDFGTDFIRPTYTTAELKDYEIGSPQYDRLEELFIQGSVKDALIEMEGLSPEEASNVSLDEAKKLYPKAVEIATKSAMVEVAGYKKGINVADAAVYVSPKMYRDMMRMIGQWSPEIENAFNILTDPTKEDLWQSDPKLYKQVMKASLKPLKYMAFGNRLDETPGLSIPYFNKMALFPLFKSIATGDMKPLYERMTDPKNPLDMIMFNSAVKAGSRGSIPYYLDISKTLQQDQTVLDTELMDIIQNHEGRVINNLNKLVVYDQEFKYLRLQLATDPHTHEELMAGTQMLKVAMSNLRLDGRYGANKEVTGREIRDKVFDAMNRLSDIGRAKLTAKLFTEDGNVNITALGKMLLDDAKDSGANDNVISGLSTKDDAFTIPLSALSDNSWIESRFISMINKATIDINLPGGAFIQRSTFGLEATSSEVISDKMLNNGKRLNLLNDDGSMDSIVSINLFKHIIPGYKNMTFDLARNWLISLNIVGDNAEATAIGYRIPTQSVASISALRFTDVFPEVMGDTIVLPEEFTKLTGSDFDVDKLYISRYQYEIQEEAMLDVEAEEGATVAKAIKSVTKEEDMLKNTIVDMYLKILSTIGNTNELKMSIDNATENVKDVLSDIESNKTTKLVTPFEVYSPSYQEERKAEYTGGKSGIGPMALNNAHHILTQLLNPRIASNTFTDALLLTDLSRVRDYPTVGNENGGRILDWLSAMINAFVDIAKDPYIVRLNVNPWTYNMTAFLLRTGKGKLTFYFIAQPILKEIAAEVLKTKGKYGVDLTRTPFELELEATDKVLDKYDPSGTIRKKYESLKEDDALANEYKDLFETYIDVDGNVTSRTRELLLNRHNVKNFNEELIRMYYAFKALKPYAQDVANLVKYSKVDTKRMGKSFAEQRTFNNGLELMKQHSKFQSGEVDRFFRESFLQTKLNNSIKFGQSIFNEQLIRNTDGFLEVQDNLLYKVGKYSNATDKLLSAVIRSTEAYIKSKFFNDRMEKRGITVTSMLYGTKTMAKRLLKFRNLIHEGKYPELLNPDGTIANDLLEYLLPNVSNDLTQPDFIDTSSIFADDKLLADNFINYWRELLESNIPEIKRFAEDLIDYAFVTSGDNNNLNSFFNYLPNSWRIENGYSQYMKEQTDLFNLGGAQVNWKDIFLNNWFNDDMVRAVKEEYPIDAVNPDTGAPTTNYTSFYSLPTNYILPGTDRTVPKVFIGEMADLKGYKGNISAVGWKKVQEWDDKISSYVVKSYPIYPPFVKIKVGLKNVPENWVMYELVGYREYTNDKGMTQRSPVYSIITKKGMKFRGHVVTEYNKSTSLPFNAGAITYDGLNSITSGDILKDIYRYDNINDGYKKQLYYMFKQVRPITELPSYTMENVDQLVEEGLANEEDAYYDQDTVQKEYETVPTVKIISGGQTGVDRIGLEAGKELGIETGGTTTPGYYTEIGRDESLKYFGVSEISEELQQGKKGKEFYLPRTEQNTLNSDGTVYFATDEDSAGKWATKRFADKHSKPFLLNPNAEQLRIWVNENDIKVLNVAGNRGSRLTEMQKNNIKNIIKDAISSPTSRVELSSESQNLLKLYKESLELLLDSKKDMSEQDKSVIRQKYDDMTKSFTGTDDELKNEIIKFICSI